MRKMLPFSWLLLGLLLVSFGSFGQRECASHEVYEQMMASDPQFVINQQKLEEATRNFIRAGGAAAMPVSQSGTIVYTIPIVFHVVYNTAAQNISDDRILAQLKVLNDDFQKLNTDWTKTPGDYQGRVADVQIEFCLAKRDPSGNATTGILRRQTTVTSFSSNNAIKYTSQGGSNAWPRESYLNFWVGNLGSSLLGYAQFPGGAAATDGVVCHYSSVGGPLVPGEFGINYGIGRTATHEIGHWLNLRHIWGDGRCANDFVDDTPVHPSSNGGCPSSTLTTSCNPNKGQLMMWMNYMDYTYDRCMYMFTEGQKNRMWPVLAPGGARASLTNSSGCMPPDGGTTCNVPGSLTSSGVTQTGASLAWSAASGATGYTLQYRSVGSGTWTSTNSSTNSATLSGLVAGTTYEWQVRSNCSGGTTSAFSASAQFTTQQPTVTCNPPTGLSVSNVTVTGATLSWTNGSGALSARLEYRTGTDPWSVKDPATSPVTLTSLSPATTYNWRVQSNCDGTTSSYENGSNFTTLPDPTACTDAYEPNNSSGSAASIQNKLGETIFAKICTTSDVDWYTFSNTNQNRAVRVTLGNASGTGYNYNMRLYRPNGQLAGTTSGTNKVLTFTGNPTGAYRIEVFSTTGSSDAEYTLLAEIGSNFREADRFMIVGSDMRSFPNPASTELLLQFGSDWAGTRTEVVMTDLLGRRVQRNVVNANGTISLDVSPLHTGLYLMQVSNGVLSKTQKVMISK